MKILLIEDDPETAMHVGDALRAQGHEVEETGVGDEGLLKARAGRHAVLIVDRMLPGLDGLSLVQRLRDEGNRTPVLFLTTMSGIDDRVAGFEVGGDDYLTKPFALRELIARVNAISKRRDVETVLEVADIEMNLLRREVRRGGKPIDLQPQEFRLLEYLLRNAGRTVTRTMLLENVWDLHFDPRTNVVETHMSRLCSKMDRGYPIERISTVRGAGYILRAD